MSGGFFDYAQHYISDIYRSIEEEIKHNDDTRPDEYGHVRGRFYGKATMRKFRKAVTLLKQAEVYAQRIDWLLSGDDGEERFHERLAEDLKALED